MCPSGLPPTDQESRRDERFLRECGFLVHRWMVDDLRAPSGWAAAPGLLTECHGRSHLPHVVSLLIPSSSYHCSGNDYRYRSEIKSKTFGL